MGEVAITLELVLAIIELGVLIVILVHMKELKGYSELEKQEIREIKRLHKEIAETVGLLEEDIRQLNENNQKTQDAIGLLKVDIKELKEHQDEMHELIKLLGER